MRIEYYNKPIEVFGKYAINVVGISRLANKPIYVDMKLNVPMSKVKFDSNVVEIDDDVFDEIKDNYDNFYVVI